MSSLLELASPRHLLPRSHARWPAAVWHVGEAEAGVRLGHLYDKQSLAVYCEFTSTATAHRPGLGFVVFSCVDLVRFLRAIPRGASPTRVPSFAKQRRKHERRRWFAIAVGSVEGRRRRRRFAFGPARVHCKPLPDRRAGRAGIGLAMAIAPWPPLSDTPIAETKEQMTSKFAIIRRRPLRSMNQVRT